MAKSPPGNLYTGARFSRQVAGWREYGRAAVQQFDDGLGRACGPARTESGRCSNDFDHHGLRVDVYRSQSHKWDLGILPASMWSYTGAHKAPTGPLAQSLGISDWLVTLSIVPAILLVGFIAGAVVLRLLDKKIWSTFSAGMAVMVLGYFMGAVGGQVYMKATEGASSHASTSPVVLHASSFGAQDQGHADQEHAVEQDKVAHEPADGDAHAVDQNADEGHAANGPAADGHGTQGHAASDTSHGAHGVDPHLPNKDDLSRDVGIFFSIYYCMTGLHAFHIVGGIAFLSWIFYRSLLGHWRPDYFGPVDYVGLYWHLVDLIWIYLFPMLYLID